MGDLIIRECEPTDFDRVNEIYNWTIIDNHVSFDIEPWDIERRTAWWHARGTDLHCLVGEIDGEVVGVTYSSHYRPKPAYSSTMETTIVLDTGHLGKGHGTRLLSALLDRLIWQGTHMAVAIVALPNVGSVEMHKRLGYRVVGTLTDAGSKFGRYFDTTILEKQLSEPEPT